MFFGNNSNVDTDTAVSLNISSVYRWNARPSIHSSDMLQIVRYIDLQHVLTKWTLQTVCQYLIYMRDSTIFGSMRIKGNTYLLSIKYISCPACC